MSNVIAVHAVGNLETSLQRDKGAFREFSSGYRIYRMPDQAKVAIVWENVDMAKLQSILATPEAKAAMKAATVLDTEVFVELDGAR
jgi:hypothetical protein